MKLKHLTSRRALTRFVAVALVQLAICASLSEAYAQSSPRIVSASASHGTFSLAWTGTAPSYQVQSSVSISTPNWQPLLVTARTNALVPLPGATVFFRIVALTTSDGTSVDDTKRFQILDALALKIGSLPGTNAPAYSQALAGFLAGFPEIIGAGVTKDTSTWARFRDGRLVVIVNNRPPATDEELDQLSRLTRAPASQPAMLAALAKAALAASDSDNRPAKHGITEITFTRPVGIPESRNAVMFQATGIGLNAPALDSLVPGLRAHGYQFQGGEAGLFELMSVKVLGDDIGVFYLDTHGLTIEGIIPYAMLTSTLADKETDALVKASFDQGEIAYGFLGSAIRRGNIVINPKPLYSILPPFVTKYWKFGKNSLVYMDVCDSAGGNAAPFIQACAEAGASVYAGWTDAVDDYWALIAARYAFGLMLGGRDFYYPIPPNRAFDWVAAKTYMHSKGWDIFPRSNAELVFFSDTSSGNGRFGLLAPSIYSMDVDEDKEELRIVGLFDPDAPVTVRIEGGATKEIAATARFIEGATIRSFSPTEIICPLPASQQPSAGNVTVIQRGHKSNTVPLTEWWVKATGHKYFSIGQPQPSSTIDFNLHFRTDVHSSRTAPYQVPVFRGNFARAARDSKVTVTSASGTYHDPNGIRTVSWSLSSPVELPAVYGSLQVDLGFSGRASFSSDGGIGLTFFATAKNTMTVTETVNNSQNSVQTDPGTRNFPDGKSQLIPGTYAIQGGSGPAAGDSGSFTWESASPKFAPDEGKPGYGAFGVSNVPEAMANE